MEAGMRERRKEEIIMPELKPCSFCGEPAIMQTFAVAGEKCARFRVKCGKCWCETDWESESAKDAAEKWNRRKENI